MILRFQSAGLVAILALTLVGCSGGGNPVLPRDDNDSQSLTSNREVVRAGHDGFR